jgi:hypothetical protein
MWPSVPVTDGVRLDCMVEQLKFMWYSEALDNFFHANWFDDLFQALIVFLIAYFSDLGDWGSSTVSNSSMNK